MCIRDRYRLITIAAVTFLIAGFSWWWIYDRQDWIVIASSAHACLLYTSDIAQITLLKGASAAALYGAVAANGAIMITTKSAQSGKVLSLIHISP